jgi:hypothetical protein
VRSFTASSGALKSGRTHGARTIRLEPPDRPGSGDPMWSTGAVNWFSPSQGREYRPEFAQRSKPPGADASRRRVALHSMALPSAHEERCHRRRAGNLHGQVYWAYIRADRWRAARFSRGSQCPTRSPFSRVRTNAYRAHAGRAGPTLKRSASSRTFPRGGQSFGSRAGAETHAASDRLKS